MGDICGWVEGSGYLKAIKYTSGCKLGTPLARQKRRGWADCENEL